MLGNLLHFLVEVGRFSLAVNRQNVNSKMLNNLGFNYAWIKQNVHNTFSFSFF